MQWKWMPRTAQQQWMPTKVVFSEPACNRFDSKGWCHPSPPLISKNQALSVWMGWIQIRWIEPTLSVMNWKDLCLLVLLHMLLALDTAFFFPRCFPRRWPLFWPPVEAVVGDAPGGSAGDHGGGSAGARWCTIMRCCSCWWAPPGGSYAPLSWGVMPAGWRGRWCEGPPWVGLLEMPLPL